MASALNVPTELSPLHRAKVTYLVPSPVATFEAGFPSKPIWRNYNRVRINQLPAKIGNAKAKNIYPETGHDSADSKPN